MENFYQSRAVKVAGKGKVSATGKLGDVMKESIQATEFFIKSRTKDFGINQDELAKTDIHVHVPEGATPKDGPSAGVAMVTSIVSSLTNIEVKKEYWNDWRNYIKGQSSCQLVV